MFKEISVIQFALIATRGLRESYQAGEAIKWSVWCDWNNTLRQIRWHKAWFEDKVSAHVAQT
jgi:hypothetical protein